MKKLTNEIMNDIILGAIESHPDISQAQLENFNKAMDGDENSPAYMFTFCKQFNPIATGNIQDKKPVKTTGRRFVITSAQNNTNIHTKFLRSLKNYCSHNKAKLLIGKYVYNKNGFQNGQVGDDEIYFDDQLDKYLTNELISLTDDLVFCGNVNILPTAKYPLSGFENYQNRSSCIFPTSKLALESIATMKIDPVKFLYGTGSITLKNYIQKKAGQVGESMHSYGALIVEIDIKNNWYVRQIETDDSGSFYDLNKFYSGDQVLKTDISAITFGDFHSEKMDYQQLDICNQMVKYLKPKDIFIHDLFDMSTRNHHNKQSGHFLYKMDQLDNSVFNDLEITAKVLQTFTKDVNIHIVESNHDQALEKWLDDPSYNYRTDPQNAKIFLELQLEKYNKILDNDFIILEHALNKFADFEAVNFLKVDQSLKIHDVEMGIHGHIGMNGSRGNPRQFQKLNMKMNTGHTHNASIYGNVYTSGVTGSLDMGYNKGASSWSHSHTLLYKNGFRSIITTKNNTFFVK